MKTLGGEPKLIRWGIIGCGDVTELKSGPAYQKVEGFSLDAVMRRSPGLAEDYANRHGVDRFYAEADALIGDADIDAIYIATPPDSHKYYALQVAAAGKPCCIEKPLAPNHADCLAITEAFKEKNTPLFVAYYRRSLPRFTQVKEWLDNGEIGEIRQINWRLTKSASEADVSGDYNWRTDFEIAPGGYFDDLASHGLDLFTYHLGNIREVYGISGNQQGFYKAKDAIVACWLHDNGIMGTGSWNFGASTDGDTVEILGSEGSITFSVFDEKPLILDNSEGCRELFIAHPDNVQLHHVENMRDDLFGKGTYPSNGETASHVGWVMDRILGTVDEA